MYIEEAIEQIQNWADGEKFVITGIVDPPPYCKNEDEKLWRQEDALKFQRVIGYVVSEWESQVYFQLPSGKWLETIHYS